MDKKQPDRNTIEDYRTQDLRPDRRQDLRPGESQRCGDIETCSSCSGLGKVTTWTTAKEKVSLACPQCTGTGRTVTNG